MIKLGSGYLDANHVLQSYSYTSHKPSIPQYNDKKVIQKKAVVYSLNYNIE